MLFAFPHSAARMNSSDEEFFELLDIHWLHEMMIETCLHRTLPILRLAVSCHGHHEGIGAVALLAQTLRHLKAVHARQSNIEEDCFREKLNGSLQGMRSIMRQGRGMTGPREKPRHRLGGVDIVVHD